MLTRDPKDGAIWYPTERAQKVATAAALIVLAGPRQDAGPVEAPTDAPADLPVERRDSSDLAATVERARALLDEGDVIAARLLASGAYREAKAQAGYAAEFGAAGKRLVAKSRQLQGDALLIETRAKIRIAAEWEKAQAEGRAAGRGRPKNIPDENVFTLAEAGLSAKEIHDARRYAEAEEKAPGLVERAIAARIEAGLEPSRANLRASIGTKTATKEERGHNLYETPAEAVHTLLALEEFAPIIWEPACGRGAISRILEAAGHQLIISDLVDYATSDQFGEVQQVRDFLESQPDDVPAVGAIITNPPYGALLNRFVAHALRVHRPRKMALLLNVNFYGGTENDDRNFALDEHPPARIHWFARRLPMMHRDGWDGPEAGSSMNTAWFVWERQEDGGYGAQTLIRRVDWKRYQPVEMAEAAE
ncbi:MAG TPA: hypothetical protein VL100_03600 [Croceibacterium sp.]|nr:hypothetical protein [Croceibacterium sp.]